MAQIVGNDIGIAKLSHNVGEPQPGGSRSAQQHAKHGDKRNATDCLAAAALTSALGVACNIIATVDLGLCAG